jgi:hypothetical protein
MKRDHDKRKKELTEMLMKETAPKVKVSAATGQKTYS